MIRTPALAVALALTWLLTGGQPAVGPQEPASAESRAFSFAALGDSPYLLWEDLKFKIVLTELRAPELRWVIHVGDLFWRPCSDDMYGRSLEQFNGLPHPVIYIPGDNEWTDCHRPASGGYPPLGRLAQIRRVFFSHPGRSLGQPAMPLATQASESAFREFPEHVRWTHEGVVFATLHVVGSENGRSAFAKRTRRDDDEVGRRTAAAVAWLRETFTEARAVKASAVILSFHANMGLERRAGRRPKVFEPIIAALEDEMGRFAGPVLAIHGDGHTYQVDHPLRRRTPEGRLPDFTRLQVPGLPDVGWVRVTVTRDPKAPFAFEPTLIPRWRFW